jgi:hypothetical protein
MLCPQSRYLQNLYNHVNDYCKNYNNLKKIINNEHNASENDVEKLLAYESQMLNALIVSELLSLKIYDDKISLINDLPYDLSNTNYQIMPKINLSNKAKLFNEFRKNNPMMMNAMLQPMQYPMIVQQQPMMVQPVIYHNMIPGGKKKSKKTKKPQTDEDTQK